MRLHTSGHLFVSYRAPLFIRNSKQSMPSSSPLRRAQEMLQGIIRETHRWMIDAQSLQPDDPFHSASINTKSYACSAFGAQRIAAHLCLAKNRGVMPLLSSSLISINLSSCMHYAVCQNGSCKFRTGLALVLQQGAQNGSSRAQEGRISWMSRFLLVPCRGKQRSRDLL